jgi:uncharacterized protein
VDLTSSETRVLGCLLEKQRTTPDHYPLTLNALRLACNQSTNRDPVVNYDDATIREALHRLERRGFTRLASGRGRSPKYRHLLAEALPMGEPEQAIVCVLMLRGAQTPGELKQRVERLHAFADLADVQDTLRQLIERALVARLERRPGQKEERYTQLLEAPPGSERERDPAMPGGSPSHYSSPGPEPTAPSSFVAEPTVSSSFAAEPTAFSSFAPESAVSSSFAAESAVPSKLIAAIDALQERMARLELEVAELRKRTRDSPSAQQEQ